MAKGAPKGHPRYGGRVKGTPNKPTQDLLNKAKELGVDPFEVLLLFAAGDWKRLGYSGNVIEPSTRAKCASDACKYLYPQRRAIEVSENPEAPIGASSDDKILTAVKEALSRREKRG